MEEHMELIARHLDRRRFEVFAICPSLESLAPFHENLIKYSDHFAPITFDYEHPFNFPALVRQIRDWRVEVMHMHNGYYRGQNLSLLAAMVAGVRKVYVTEHLAPEQPEMRHHALMRNLFVRFVSGTICVSEKNYQAREKLLYTPPERTFIVENGVDLDDFQPIPEATLAELRARYSLPPDAEIVGTIVRFEPPKGLEYLIDAMVKIRQARPKAYLLMVGDGTIRAELEARCARLNLTEFTRFTGFQTEPRPYLGLMDVFVLPVPVGSMSIALLEAMAMRRAVVMTFGGKGEAVVHDENGLCAEPRSADAISEAVIRLLSSTELRNKLGAAARSHVERHFSAETTARKLEDIYTGGLDLSLARSRVRDQPAA
ncbi:MAG: glycosyltransferase family 4 protein [Myxococcales bacterium]|jgi:glycosyltransferase involved in cell wall biosynthesis